MSDINANEYSAGQLREWLRELNLTVSGNKATLLLRLNAVPANERGVCSNLMDKESDVSVTSDSDQRAVPEVNETDREVELLRTELVLMKKELMSREIEVLKAGATPAPTRKETLDLQPLKHHSIL